FPVIQISCLVLAFRDSLIYEQPFPTLDIPISLLFYPPPYIVFKVSGQSMAPHVMLGDLVICSQDWRDLDVNGKIMAFRTPDGITLKKLIEDYKHKPRSSSPSIPDTNPPSIPKPIPISR
ncbi:MAG: S24 family peptidase, partial [Candidatus Cloacimonadaceae bacterium]